VAILDKVLEDKNGNPIKDNDVFNMLTFELFRDLISFLSIHGRAFVWKNILPKSKTILSLEVLNPQALESIRWPKSSQRFGIMKYRYKQDQVYWDIMPENMIVITQFHPLQAYPYNNERGMSGLSASDYAIDADRKSDIWNAKFFENGGFAGNMLLTDQPLNAEA
jgi:phage portal protein BeeE